MCKSPQTVTFLETNLGSSNTPAVSAVEASRVGLGVCLLVSVFAYGCSQLPKENVMPDAGTPMGLSLSPCAIAHYDGNATGDGDHCIDLSDEHGPERFWVRAIAPQGEGPFPVVVYAKGQGASNTKNCFPDRAPPVDAKLAALRDQGYLVVALGYRNDGAGIPAVAPFVYRDHHLRDARTVLAAAQWAATMHGKGSPKIALLGSSMGTWGVLWAVSAAPELASLQEGLDVRTAILVGESANHLANGATSAGVRKHELWDTGTADDRFRIALGGVVGAAIHTARAAEALELAEEDFQSGTMQAAMQQLLTADGIAFARSLLVTAAADVPECQDADQRSALCSASCLAFAQRRIVDQGLLATPEQMFVQTTFDAFDWWPRVDLPIEQLEPTQEELASNSFLALLHSGSPVYGAKSPLISDRFLHLLAQGDTHYDANAQRLLSGTGGRLATLGAAQVSAPPISDPICGHHDYLDAAKPACGILEVTAELSGAFAD
jgi:pimeloyl-ACP methyl ester carboxylesterase